ncbi:MAG: iron ABC transporter permease [Verrucomicrobiota bacterium]
MSKLLKAGEGKGIRAFRPAALVLLVVAIVALGLGYLTTGAVETDWGSIWSAFSTWTDSSAAFGLQEAVIREIRLPRLVAGLLVGTALTLAGTLMQGLFRNPLADPALIGVSSGGAMGGILAIVGFPLLFPNLDLGMGAGAFVLPLCAMGGAIGLTFLIYRVSLVRGKTHVPAMLLTGIAVNAIGGAFVGLMLTVFATDAQLRSVTFWTLGSLGGSNWTSTGILALFIIPGVAISLRQGRSLNAFLLGEAEAVHLGVSIQRMKRLVIIVSALMVGVTVAFCGIIGFVGLVVPHMIRTVFGPDHNFLLPAGALLGAVVLVAADLCARTVVAPAELQIGILTALLGGPFFLALLLGARKGGASLGGT